MKIAINLLRGKSHRYALSEACHKHLSAPGARIPIAIQRPRYPERPAVQSLCNLRYKVFVNVCLRLFFRFSRAAQLSSLVQQTLPVPSACLILGITLYGLLS